MRISSTKLLKDDLFSYDIKEVEEAFEFLSQFKEIDDKGRYLHWNEFKRKPIKADLDHELAWALVKMLRKQLYRKIKLGKYTFNFCTPDSLQRMFHQIDKEASGNIGMSNPDGISSSSKFLVSSLIMEEAISSAQLEGAATTRKVAREMLKTERKPRNTSEKMIFNNYLLMKHAVSEKNNKLTPELILNFHAIATNDAIENDAISGEFRITNDIYVKDSLGEIVYTPPEENELEVLINELCDFINSDHDEANADFFLHPVAKAIILHFLIGFIHPFGDGNGRTARALFYWYMIKSGYWLFEYISISKLLKNAPVAYAKSYLYVEDDELDMTYFIYYQSEIIIRSIKELHDYLIGQQREIADFLTNIKNDSKVKDLNFRQIEILKKSVKEPGRIFIAKEISTEFDVAENTARADLKELETKGYLLQLSKSKPIMYISPANLKTMLFS